MKKLTTVSLFIFWAVVTAVLGAGLFYHASNKTNSNPTSSTPGNSVSSSTKSLLSTANFTLNMAEISKHNSVNDCWLLINGKVYDVTSSIPAHPGGVNEIVKFCGEDATVAFNTKDGRGSPHSGSANAMLANYYIGNLNQTIGSGQIQQNIQKASQVTPTTRRREGGDE
jgi:cytochrome b involved in lipid metabolism